MSCYSRVPSYCGLKVIIAQNGSSGDEYEPASPCKHYGTWSEFIRNVCHGWPPPPPSRMLPHSININFTKLEPRATVMITRTLITVATTARSGMVIYMVMTMTMTTTTTTTTITITRTITNMLVRITVMNIVEKNYSVLFKLSVSAPVYLISGCLCHSTHQPEQRATNGFDTALRAGHQVSRL